ncbi:aldehyde dehydrogenase family protein [Streptomyces sp. NBC_00885]|uniref:aldehyde dehydrogenase family protein n=1 Tax=Streptomyces sp. NBC_00885 TaxID=2975857 RepID=UPI003869EF73
MTAVRARRMRPLLLNRDSRNNRDARTMTSPPRASKTGPHARRHERGRPSAGHQRGLCPGPTVPPLCACFAKSARAGIVWVNTHGTTVSEMPHGGVRHSGYGSDLSMAGLLDYTQVKHVML